MSIVNLRVKDGKILDVVNERSHTEIAEEIMRDFRFATLNDTKEILVYRNGRYESKAKILIEEECQKRIPKCTSHKVREVVKTIQRSTYVDRKSFDNFPNLINLKNGVYDIVKGEFFDHTPNLLFRIQYPIEYNPSIGPEKYMKFLMECLPDYKDRITIFEEMASILLPNLRLEKAYIHHGDGNNGKSTQFSVIKALFGHENISHISIHDLINHRFARSSLDGKILNTHSEISNDEIHHLGIVKALISGDPVSVEKKGKDEFTLENKAKFFFSANELPEISNFKFAELRRFIITKWSQKFMKKPTEEDLKNGIKSIDITLKHDLTSKKELSGILNLLLFHAKKLLKNKAFSFDQSFEQLEKEWKLKVDHIESFVTSCIIKNTETNTSKSILYENYKTWCSKNKIIAKSQREFNSKIKQNWNDARVKIDGKTTVVWTGIEIKNSMVTLVTELPTIQTEKQKGRN